MKDLLVKLSSWQTNEPFIFINGAHIGGGDELQAAAYSGLLGKMLTEAGINHSFVGGSTINTTIPTTKKEDAKYLGSRSYTNPGESFIKEHNAPPENNLGHKHRDVQVEE